MNIVGTITSKQNATVMRAASLSEKKYRDETGCFLIEGEKLFFEAIKASLIPEEIFVSESEKERLLPIIKEKTDGTPFQNVRLYILSDACFSKISSEKAPEGLILLARHLDFFEKCIKIDGRVFFNEEERMLALYDVRDPGNMGAILRSALAFGVQRVILCGHCVDLYNHKTVRASMGALFHLTFAMAPDFSLFANALHAGGRRILAAELTESAKPINTLGVTARDVFLIGNEGHGIKKEVSALCDSSAYIPISPMTESLNAAVAASVLLWEQRRTQE